MKNIIVSTQQMKLLENASQSEGISLYTLMINAGTALADIVKKTCDRKSIKNIIILCGKGNNGGDGFVCADILSEFCFDVTVILCQGKPATELSQDAFSRLDKSVKICDNLVSVSNDALYVDCVFGTGFHGDIREQKISDIFKLLDNSQCYIIACDIPSGNNADGGTACKNAVKANITVTMGAQKTGMLFNPCKENCGKIIVCDIGIPDKSYDAQKNTVKHLNTDYIKKLIPKRKSDANKGTYGKLLNIAGSRSYIGAALLSTKAALRSGAGLCTLLSDEQVINNISGHIPEAVYSYFSSDTERDIDLALKKAKESNAVLIGCGMGNNEKTGELVEKLILECECPLIIDADGLNVLASRIDILRKAKASIILTPHPGEFSRLTGISIGEILDNRLRLCDNFAREYGLTLVLKGAGTVIADKGKALYVSSKGNPGLSRGGSGDVLAGMIASFTAQGLKAADSACSGVYLHGLCADRIADKLSMQGMLPSDICNELPLLFHDLYR